MDEQYRKWDEMKVLYSPYYAVHVSAMTREGLHDKSDICIELASRDLEIAELKLHIERLKDLIHEAMMQPSHPFALSALQAALDLKLKEKE